MSERTKATESKVEVAKRGGRFLRGSIAETLSPEASHFGPADVHLLKFHGVYQQDDRDLRRGRGEDEEKAYSFMTRVALPAGVLSADQYLAFDELADAYANGSLRVTTRQGFQFHGVLKGDLKRTVASINQALATTLAACGDVERNVMGCPAPLADGAHRAVRQVARQIASELRPASRAYHEIWLDGDRVLSTEAEEPFYGDRYLPRKFKTAIGLSTDNCVDVYSHDAALQAIVRADTVAGFNLLVGGGLGMTHGKGDTVARLADPLGWVSEAQAAAAVKIVAAIFRDHGNRADRRHARLKYLLHDWGLDRFRDEFRRRAPFELRAPVPLAPAPFHDHLGPHAQNDGRWFYGIFIQSGRIADSPDHRLKSALRHIVSTYRPGLALTPQQNLLLTGLKESDLGGIEALLLEHGAPPPSTLPAARRFSMACPALPTCGLAVAESERLLPAVLDGLERELDALGLRDVPITIRMTGCPNGCARPYTADLAFVGRSLDLYNIYVGGGLAADRVVDLYHADVRTPDLVAAVQPLFARWAEERLPDEGLGDFFQRILGRAEARRSVTGRESETRELVQLHTVP